MAVPANPDLVSATPRAALLRSATWVRQRVTTGMVDAALWVLATIGAFILRYDGMVPAWTPVLAAALGLIALKLLASAAFGLQR